MSGIAYSSQHLVTPVILQYRIVEASPQEATDTCLLQEWAVASN